MKRIISILLAFTMIMAFAGCDQQDQQKADENAVTNGEAKEVEYTFYIGNGVSGEGDVAYEGFLYSKDHDFLGAGERAYLNEDEVEYELTKTFGGTEYTFSYHFSKDYQYGNEEKETLGSYRRINCYSGRTEDTLHVLYVYAETGAVQELSILGDQDAELPYHDFSDKEKTTFAGEVVANLCGKNALDGYVIRNIAYSEDSGCHNVIYQRTLHGYKVDSILEVHFNNNGELRSVFINRHYLYDAIESRITKEMIQNAEKALREKIPDNVTVQEDQIAIKFDYVSGKLYLAMETKSNEKYTNPINGESYYRHSNFYVNIE